MTLPGLFNCGNRLQCYAVCSIYKKLGHDPVSLTPKRSKAVRNAKRLLGREWRTEEEMMDPRRAARFDRFNELIEERVVNHPYKLLRRQYDLFSVGSDQTWNPNLVRGRHSWFFLGFVRENQRIALSPSIGVDHLGKSGCKMLRKGVSGFKTLSIREQRGAELIREYAGLSAQVLCDPTLVIREDEWLGIANHELTPAEPFIFSYMLGGDGVIPDDVMNHLEGGRGVRVISSGSDREGEVPAGPAEFISLIENAEHVVTDSFHAAEFACILQTPLTIVRREGGPSMFSRLEQLSRMLDIDHKIYGSEGFDIARAGDYEGVPEVIERERGKFLDYLEACLHV